MAQSRMLFVLQENGIILQMSKLKGSSGRCWSEVPRLLSASLGPTLRFFVPVRCCDLCAGTWLSVPVNECCFREERERLLCTC